MPAFRRGRGWGCGIILLLCIAAGPVSAQGFQAVTPGLEAAVEYLCSDVLDGAEPDPLRIAPVIAHVRANQDAAQPLAEYRNAPGAYAGFRIGMSLQRLLRYLYNPKIPEEVLKPFSLRSSVWLDRKADAGQRRLWQDPWPPREAVVIRGGQRDRSTPDPSTGGCYEMVLRRAVILLPAEGAALSVSVQQGESEVGTRGYLLGPHSDGRYVYSGEKGLTRAGLGWVSSRIQTNISIGVYLEDSPGQVASGVFQWIRAGWSGLSVVTSGHVASSLARYRTLMTRRLERGFPEAADLEGLYDTLAGLSGSELRGRAREVFTRWMARFGGDVPRAVREILENGYADRLDRGELLALAMREKMENYSPSDGAQAFSPTPILPFQVRSTSR